jgi:hypothetical protein
MSDIILLILFIISRKRVKIRIFLLGHEMDIEVLIQNNEPKLILISDNFPPLEPSFYEQGMLVIRIMYYPHPHTHTHTNFLA